MIEVEEWKDIPGYEGYYQVSDYGRIRGTERTVRCGRGNGTTLLKSKIKKQQDNEGYLMVTLSKKSKQNTMLSHRLVALVFIPNPENKPDINHKNGIKSDNRRANLEWSTESENTQHAHRTGLMPIRKGENSGHVKLTDAQVLEIRAMEGKLQEVADIFGVSKSTIHAITSRRNWKHI